MKQIAKQEELSDYKCQTTERVLKVFQETFGPAIDSAVDEGRKQCVTILVKLRDDYGEELARLPHSDNGRLLNKMGTIQHAIWTIEGRSIPLPQPSEGE